MEHVVNVEFGGRTVTISTGKMAKQANGAVMVRCGDTMVLVTAVAQKEAKEGQDFFPLTVNYTEKAYAGGKIPGSFFKREARPSDPETLICRLIDRPIRPLFPETSSMTPRSWQRSCRPTRTMIPAYFPCWALRQP